MPRIRFQKLFTTFSCKLLACSKYQLLKCDLSKLEKHIGKRLSASSSELGSLKYPPSMPIVEELFENSTLGPLGLTHLAVSTASYPSGAQLRHSCGHDWLSGHWLLIPKAVGPTNAILTPMEENTKNDSLHLLPGRIIIIGIESQDPIW
ncbi:hypothetical protein Adt_20515 [Abeliophyllum distichum]|uniref:Uncharacterized protein n=1 Tax=Abeliophyllum distichum TaxID=126358 RepID=A0ABD1SWR6_9LAMI